MPLFTTPATFNDGADDRIFDFQRQQLNAIGGVYNEPAASPMAQSELMTLHTTAKSKKERHLLQSSEMVALVEPGEGDPSTDSIVVNITVAHHRKHAAADVEKRLKILLAAAGLSGFTAKFMARNI